MELAFYQTAWHDIPLKDLGEGSAHEVADRRVYSAFYQSLASKADVLEGHWIDQKKRLGAWLAETFLAGKKSPALLSIGAGLGFVEEELLRRGFPADVLECEPNALNELKKRIPGLKGFVGDARDLPCDAATYDLAYLSAVDYCFTREDYARVLGEMKRVLKPDGRAVSICVSNLSVKGMLKGFAKKAIGRKPAPGAVLWGYQRSVAEHLKAGAHAGLTCPRIFLFRPDSTLKGVRYAGKSGFSAMTFSDDVVAFEFTPIS